MAKDRTVAFALLTQRQLDTYGSMLKRVIPVTKDDRFDALLKALDAIDGGKE